MAARSAGLEMSSLSGDERNYILQSLRRSLAARRDQILAANERDLHDVAKEDVLASRLILTEAKFDGLLEGVDQVIEIADPVRFDELI